MDTISLLEMGSGVMNIVGLLVDLAMAENNLFLIEELENDIHPKAMKDLLDLVIEKSKNNQFIITTHSNIVLKKLGALENSKVFYIDISTDNGIPTSEVKVIDSCPETRRQILEDLGYEFADVGLWTGWMFFEEASAEKIVREYLVKWFAPKLHGKLRTYSANSISEVRSKFDNFNDLFVFLHLEPSYKNKAWVIIDAGDEEKKIIDITIYKKPAEAPMG
jgi:hypothetical protein